MARLTNRDSQNQVHPVLEIAQPPPPPPPHIVPSLRPARGSTPKFRRAGRGTSVTPASCHRGPSEFRVGSTRTKVGGGINKTKGLGLGADEDWDPHHSPIKERKQRWEVQGGGGPLESRARRLHLASQVLVSRSHSQWANTTRSTEIFAGSMFSRIDCLCATLYYN